MTMTADQRTRAQKFLEGKMRGVCPSCGHRNFEVADLVNTLPYEPGGGLVLSPQTIPLLLVVCKSCMHVVPFAAVPMGLVLPATSLPPAGE